MFVASNYLSKWIRRCLMTVVLVSCVLNFVLTPYFEYVLMDEKFEYVIAEIKRLECLYTQSLSVACFGSLTVLWIKYRPSRVAYDRLMELHDAYSPTTAAECKGRAAFAWFTFVACAAATLPANVHRLLTLYANSRATVVMAYFVFVYAQNATMCVAEMHFVVLCHALHAKLVKVNRDIERVDDDIGDDGRPPHVQHTTAGPQRGWTACRGPDGCRNYHYCSRVTGRSLADCVERMKIRHRLTREALERLNRAFAIPLGLSLCNLCVMALIDIFYHVTNNNDNFKMNVYLYLWLTQYTFRFSIIVMIVHVTTKQARRSKEIVMNISRHYLDVGIKEELQIFSNQISSTTVEFTICDLFTLNTRLFTSAIGASITYFVILLQIFR